MTTNMTVSAQWASRPNDQRFLTVDDLYAKVSSRRLECREEGVALDLLQVQPTADDQGIEVFDPQASRRLGMLTHWSFSQLASRAKAPAGYLRTLPPMLACATLQWSLETHERETAESNDAKLMLRKNGHEFVSAVTSPTYGRIWDEEVVRAVRDRIDLDQWKVPSASYSSRDPLRATTLYASDRDVFMFLVNENSIDVEGESLKRGFYVWNSEVGSSTFGIATFTYDFVCDNRIIWGQKNFREIKVRHTAGGPHRFMSQALPQLREYANSATAGQAEVIRKAKATEVGKSREDVLSWMRQRGFTVPQARRAYSAAEADPRGYNPRTIWGLVQGATDMAHDVAFTDERVAIEERAGTLLETLD